MVDVVSSIISAIFVGLGVSIGNVLYSIFLEDYFKKIKKQKKNIRKHVEKHVFRNPWIAAFLNFFLWGIGYLYIGRKRLVGVFLFLIQIYLALSISTADVRISTIFETLNYSFMTLILSAFIAFDAYILAKQIK